MPRPRPFFLALLLALALFVGQQAALLHGLAHAADSFAQDQAPVPAQCADHLFFTAFGGAITGKPPVAPFVASVAPAPAVVAQRSASLPPRHAFHSRAPPASPA